MKAPRKEYSFRDLDEVFVKSLMAKFKENEVPFGPKPQLGDTKRGFDAKQIQQRQASAAQIGGNWWQLPKSGHAVYADKRSG